MESDWPRITIGQAMDRAAARWPQAEFMLAGEDRVSFADFRRRALELAGGLRRQGLRRGDHLAICMGNGVDWALLFCAAAVIGAVTVPVNTRFKATELEYCLRQADIRFLCVADRFLAIDFIALLREVCPEIDTRLPGRALPKLEQVFVFGSDIPAGCQDAAVLRGEAGQAAEGPAPDDVALIQYTSGTTAFPKGAMLSHDGMLRDAWHYGKRLGMGEGDRYYSARPLYHVAGSTLSLLASLVAGVCYITTAHFDVAEGLRLMEAERCAFVSGNDTMLLMLMNHPDFESRKLVLRGGMVAANPAVLELAMQRMGLTDFCTGYGLSEGSPNCALGPYDEAVEKRLAGYAVPMPGVSIRIRHPDEPRDCAADEKGEILVHGWNVMKGYYNMPEQTAKAIDSEGWLHTGDLGLLDPEGRLRFDGRIKDLFRVGGENVAPAEVEAVLHRHPAVKMAQVIGVPDPRLLEVPAAFIILKPGAEATAEEMIAWCKARSANFRVPRHVHFLEDFETIGMTGSGKVQKNKLRDFALVQFGLQP